MLAHSPKDRSTEMSAENETHQRFKSLKEKKIRFFASLKNYVENLRQTLSTEEEMKSLEKVCLKEYSDLPEDRVRRMIRTVLKVKKSSTSSKISISDKETSNNETNPKKTRRNSIELKNGAASSLNGLENEFVRQAFSQQFRPSIDFSAYFAAAAAAAAATTNGSIGPSGNAIFRPSFSSPNFVQASSGATTKTNRNAKLSSQETTSVQVLVNAYREAAAYLSRSADELEQFL